MASRNGSRALPCFREGICHCQTLGAHSSVTCLSPSFSCSSFQSVQPLEQASRAVPRPSFLALALRARLAVPAVGRQQQSQPALHLPCLHCCLMGRVILINYIFVQGDSCPDGLGAASTAQVLPCHTGTTGILAAGGDRASCMVGLSSPWTLLSMHCCGQQALPTPSCPWSCTPPLLTAHLV